MRGKGDPPSLIAGGLEDLVKLGCDREEFQRRRFYCGPGLDRCSHDMEVCRMQIGKRHVFRRTLLSASIVIRVLSRDA
jgi:hypothetical protein